MQKKALMDLGECWEVLSRNVIVWIYLQLAKDSSSVMSMIDE